MAKTIRLPSDVKSQRELIWRYVALDSEAGCPTIVKRIEKDHGIKLRRQSVSNARLLYFASIKKQAPKLTTSYFGRKKARTSGSVSLSEFKAFLESVKRVGGATIAKELLELMRSI